MSSIKLEKGNFVDFERKSRDVPFKIYAPCVTKSSKFPVIFWSHGLGGGRDGAGFIARYLAERGYILVHLQHVGTDSSLWEGKKGHPWDIILKTPISRETTLDRFKDVSFVFDQLEKGEGISKELYDQIDFACAGMSGHSFGALTTQVITGQRFPNEQDILSSYLDSRFKAAIAYSPVPISHLSEAEDKDIYSYVAVPTLYMTGTNDESPATGKDFHRCLHVYDHNLREDKRLLVLKDGDHMVFSGSRGKLSSNPKRKTHEKVIQEASLAFWDFFLKGDEDATDRLDALIESQNV